MFHNEKCCLSCSQCRTRVEDSELDEWTEVDRGQAFSVIRTSRLCDTSLLTDLNLMFENSDVSKIFFFFFFCFKHF